MLCLTDKAPLSKSLLLLPTVLTVLLTVLLPQYQDLFIYNLKAVRQGKQVRDIKPVDPKISVHYILMHTFNYVYRFRMFALVFIFLCFTVVSNNNELLWHK